MHFLEATFASLNFLAPQAGAADYDDRNAYLPDFVGKGTRRSHHAPRRCLRFPRFYGLGCDKGEDSHEQE